MATAPFAPLQHRDYRLLWGGLFVSQVGSQMQVTALTWHVYALTHSPLWLGAIGAVRFLPMILMALLGGVVADSVDRRRLLIGTQLGLLGASALLAFTTQLQTINLTILYLATGASSALMALDTPARQALFPSLVPAALMPRAVSLNMSTAQVATVVGPAVGGLVLAAAGPGAVYWLDAMSYTGVLTALLLMHYRPSVASMLRPSWAAVMEGLRFVRRTHVLWSTMWLDFLATFFGGCMLLLPVFAHDLLDVGPTGYGFLVAAPAIGATLTAAVLAVRGLPQRQGLMVITAVGLYGVALALFGMSTSYALSIILLAASGAADTASTVVRQTLRWTVTPENMRGRLTSINMIFFSGGPQLGEAEAGFVARMCGARVSVILGGMLCLALAAVYGLKDHRLRDYAPD